MLICRFVDFLSKNSLQKKLPSPRGGAGGEAFFSDATHHAQRSAKGGQCSNNHLYNQFYDVFLAHNS